MKNLEKRSKKIQEQVIEAANKIKATFAMNLEELRKFESLNFDSLLIDRQRASLITLLGSILGNKKEAKAAYQDLLPNDIENFEKAFEMQKSRFAQTRI